MDNIQIEPDLDVYFSQGIWLPRRLVIIGFDRLGHVDSFNLDRRKSDPITLQKYETTSVGGPVHLAPENYMDSSEAVGEGVDTYALGILMKQLVEARVFSSNSLAPAFIEKMCVDNATERLGLAQVLDYVSASVW
jgi:hypothetical protein